MPQFIETPRPGISLNDCYTADKGPALASGTQALVRLLLEQAKIDRDAGLNTKGLVSGYPGSPLGGLDLELARSKRFLDAAGIVFQPGVNEELAATALWGSQHIGLYDETECDGVFALWYGKGPGLDRSMDALRHANQGGVAPKGGMVIAVGDDPTGKSSTLAYQSDQSFVALGMPYFFPRRVEDIIPMGLEAFALSRYAGCCVGLKIIVDTADANVILDLGAIWPLLKQPEAEAGPVHVGRHDPSLVREARLQTLRLPAVAAWQAANPSGDHVVPVKKSAPGKGRLGLVSVGKATPETHEALVLLGVDDPAAVGIGHLSLKMPWPVDRACLLEFAGAFDEVLVIEEKRPLVEDQLARLLVNMQASPRLSGKTGPDGEILLPGHGELTPEIIAAAVVARAGENGLSLADLPALPDLAALPAIATRTPYYCAGCPHNTSTRLPDGTVTGMGIGCHSISGFITPDTITNFTQMGGEGAFWIGRAPFSDIDHTFQNMGDGTYAHSGYLGIRAAVAAKVNMTFKMLINDAVAMTGGQAAAGGAAPDAIARQMAAEGVTPIVVVSDAPESLRSAGDWPQGTAFHHRRDIIAVQDDLSRQQGVSGLLYIQTCAAELRRRRKRGRIPDRPQKLFIHEEICEGCGDCARKSNCVAVKPVVRPEGIKRQIDQTVCNKDYSCNEGFCPSFIAVTPQTNAAPAEVVTWPELPDEVLPPPPAPPAGVSNIFLAGIGGTGVSTLSAVLVMAARIDGIAAQAVNQTGLSQKNGGVTAQIRMSAETRLDDRMVRLPGGSADLLLGCDAVVAANDVVLRTLNRKTSTAILNARIDPVGVAGVGAGHVVDDSLILKRLEAVMHPDRLVHADATVLAEALLGSATTANVMLLGMALQKGLLPVSADALAEALRHNGVAVADNLKALDWGRWFVVDEARVRKAAGQLDEKTDAGVDALPAAAAEDYFAAKLIAYQDAAYADRFRRASGAVRAAVAQVSRDDDRIARKAVRALYRVMLIKDEYEIARLMTSAEFAAEIESRFGSGARLGYHLAPPMMGWLKNRDGTPRKLRFGGWMRGVFSMLARLRFLRGSAVDPFGWTAERRREIAFRDQIESLLADAAASLDRQGLNRLDALLEAVLSVRGYGHIKAAAMDDAERMIATLAMPETTDNLSPRLDKTG